jgi:hypothetical protein
VPDDGVVSVTEVEGESEPVDVATVVLEYQNMRNYLHWCERGRMEDERRRRAEPAGPLGAAGGSGAMTGPPRP